MSFLLPFTYAFPFPFQFSLFVLVTLVFSLSLYLGIGSSVPHSLSRLSVSPSIACHIALTYITLQRGGGGQTKVSYLPFFLFAEPNKEKYVLSPKNSLTCFPFLSCSFSMSSIFQTCMVNTSTNPLFDHQLWGQEKFGRTTGRCIIRRAETAKS